MKDFKSLFKQALTNYQGKDYNNGSEDYSNGKKDNIIRACFSFALDFLTNKLDAEDLKRKPAGKDNDDRFNDLLIKNKQRIEEKEDKKP